jgi:putative glutamine amidotransferase
VPVIGVTANRARVGQGEEAMTHHVAPESYLKAVRLVGGAPVVIPSLDPDDHEGRGHVLDSVDAVVVTGGPDIDPSFYGRVPERGLGPTEPDRDRADLALVRALVERDQPTLCICRGVQVLNVALGGTLVQHLDHHMRLDRYNHVVHQVSVEPSSTLASIVGRELGVNTLHHQCIDEPAPGARVVARAEDGTIEAIEVTGAAHVLGVQWHPELVRHLAPHRALFERLAEWASQERARRSR